MEDAVMPFPKPEMTPPVTKIYFIVSMGLANKPVDYKGFRSMEMYLLDGCRRSPGRTCSRRQSRRPRTFPEADGHLLGPFTPPSANPMVPMSGPTFPELKPLPGRQVNITVTR